MKTDPLGRRDRFNRQPRPEYTKGGKEKKTKVTSTDIVRYAFMARHGGRLPTSMIHESTIETQRDIDSTRRRLAINFDQGYLEREKKQKYTDNPHANELVHKLTPKAFALLKEYGFYSEFFPTITGWFPHQVMLSCISASFELNMRKATGLHFTPQHEMLEVVNHTARIALTGKDYFTPDLVFKVTVNNRDLLVFMEIDRATEVNESSNPDRKSWKKSIRQYHDLISTKKYKELFGVKDNCAAILMIVTVNAGKQNSILGIIEKEFDKPCSYMMVTYMPEFGEDFHPPKSLDMLGIKWKRCGEQKDFSLS